MTDQDNLRDRIAELIDPNAWKMYRIPNMPGWSESAELVEPSREKAQAIIDELGLTVETSIDLGALPDHLQGVWMDDPAFREWETKQPRKTRVVGKWERPEQEPRP